MTDDYQDETGEEIVRALKSAGAEAVRKALIGCLFYRDDPDDAAKITAVPTEERVFILQDHDHERRLPYGLIEQGYVIPSDSDLRAALTAARTPEDERLDHAAIVLARHRIKASSLSVEDRLVVADAIETTDTGELPDRALRLRSYQVLRDRELRRQAIPLLERWNEMLPSDSAEATAVLIELAACYRHSGQIERAFGTIGRLAGPARTMQPGTKAVFACEHAAILMDMFERDGEQRRLEEARRWAGVAWRYDQSDYVSQLYQRLKSLEAKN